MKYNIDTIIKAACDTVSYHKLEADGEYTRWLWQDENKTRKLGLNEYGCADAANILYSIGQFPSSLEERKSWIKTLQNFQDPITGLFSEETHHFIHTTAHCIAALELFDVKPRFALVELLQYSTLEGIEQFLENLDWENDPWDESHKGAGIYAALVLSDSVQPQWSEKYFEWLWNNADSETGFWKKQAVSSGRAPLFHHLAGTFHYLFNLEYARMPLKYPDKVIDTCISLYEENNISNEFGRRIGFSEVDWVYCLNRASRQTSHRFNDCKRVLEKFAKQYIEYLNSIDTKTHDGFNDLHGLFGTICSLAELQLALPGMIISKKPLKSVLDRRPFI